MAGNREYKSDVFSMLLEDPSRALELYNALNHSDYTDPGLVEICTFARGISLSVRSDAAFLIVMAVLALYEHQSTVCPNLPVRKLIYVADQYERWVRRKDIYGERLVRIPTPQFVTFYNGMARQPERQELRLSDAFLQPTDDPQLELKCMVYNINRGMNGDLLGQCPSLRGYMTFVDYVREYKDRARSERPEGVTGMEGVEGMEEMEGIEDIEGMDLMWAISRAIDRCIREGVLREFFMKRRGEVMKVVYLDYTYESRLEMQRMELEQEAEHERREKERERREKERERQEKERERQRADLAEAELRKLWEELGISNGSPANRRSLGRRIAKIFSQIWGNVIDK